MRFILASKSPRRRELLQRILPSFDVMPSGEPEDMTVPLEPDALVASLAAQKAKSVADRLDTPADEHPETTVVIGCDTIVVSPDGEVFGTPQDEAEARRMLSTLSARTHAVMTACHLLCGSKSSSFVECTQVVFYPISPTELNDYLATNEPYDKAGGYGIQSGGGLFVKEIHGDFYTVVGLPVARLRRALDVFIND